MRPTAQRVRWLSRGFRESLRGACLSVSVQRVARGKAAAQRSAAEKAAQRSVACLQVHDDDDDIDAWGWRRTAAAQNKACPLTHTHTAMQQGVSDGCGCPLACAGSGVCGRLVGSAISTLRPCHHLPFPFGAVLQLSLSFVLVRFCSRASRRNKAAGSFSPALLLAARAAWCAVGRRAWGVRLGNLERQGAWAAQGATRASQYGVAGCPRVLIWWGPKAFFFDSSAWVCAN